MILKLKDKKKKNLKNFNLLNKKDKEKDDVLSL